MIIHILYILYMLYILYISIRFQSTLTILCIALPGYAIEIACIHVFGTCPYVCIQYIQT